MSCDGIPVIIPESSNAGPGGLTINCLYLHPEHAYDFVFIAFCVYGVYHEHIFNPVAFRMQYQL